MPNATLLSGYHRWLENTFLPDPTYTCVRRGNVVRQYGPASEGNYVCYVGAANDPAAFQTALAEELAFFQARGGGFEWKYVRGRSPQGAETALIAAGFVPGEREVALGFDLAGAVPPPVVLPDNFSIRPLETREDLAQVASLQAEIWDRDFAWLSESLWQELTRAPSHMSLHGVFTRGLLVAQGWLRCYPSGVVGLFGGCTRPGFRSKGLFRAMVGQRQQVAVGGAAPFSSLRPRL
ncbi:MAG: hypothetical protein ACFB21_04480 [Opitutales bacterium]